MENEFASCLPQLQTKGFLEPSELNCPKAKIVDNFIEQYENGQTPNPCVRCNQYIKFAELWKKLKPMGVDFVATGHYAKLKASAVANAMADKQIFKFKLLKSKDKEKDQTYFLHQVSQNELKHTLFPIGELTKKEVRALAKKFGLATAEKKESHEICFVADGQVGDFLKRSRCIFVTLLHIFF